MPAAETFCPYVGLGPYSPEHSAYFFGREREQAVVMSNLFASPLTVLYGASGVGKSSLLRAGVVPELERTGRAAAVYFNRWKDPSFAYTLKRELIEAASRARGEPVDLDPALALDALLEESSRKVGGAVLAVLDQFEDYLLYAAESEQGEAFHIELGRAVNRRDLDTGFLIAIREDWLSRLQDHFKRRLPILRNTLRLRHMEAAAAERAIRGPLERFNERAETGAPPVTIEDRLVEQILADTRTGRVSVSESAGTGLPANGERGIEGSFLQLVLTKLWEAETAAGSRTLRIETLDRLGGAEKIVRDHVAGEMRTLTEPERDLCAQMFRFLVMPGGSKIAQRTEDLAGVAGQPVDETRRVLERLARDRILARSYPPERYEIFHDVLAPAILDWRARYQEAQELAAAQRRLEAEARNARRFRRLAIGLFVMFVLAVAAGVVAYRRSIESRSRELAASAVAQLPIDPERSIVLALYALRSKRTLEAENALHRALVTSRVRRTFATGDCRALRTAVSPDGSRNAAACQDGTARIWDTTGRQEASLRGHRGEVYDVAFSPDGRQLTTAGRDGTVRIWDPATGDSRVTLAASGVAINAVAFSGDGGRVAVGDANGAASLWDARSGRKLVDFRERGKSILGISVDSDGARVATADLDGSVRVWDADSGAEIRRLLTAEAPVWGVAFSPDGGRVAAAIGDRTVGMWDAETGAPLQRLRGHSNYAMTVVFSPDGRRLASAGVDETAKVWDARTGNELMTLAGHSATVHSAAFGPEGKTLITGSLDGTVRTWDLGPGAERFAIDAGPAAVESVQYSPGGESLVTASTDRTVRIYASATGTERSVLAGHEGEVWQAVFRSDGKRIASAARDFTARIWDIRLGRETVVLKDAAEWVRSVAFSPDGGLVLTGNLEGHAKLWDAEGGTERADLAAHSDRIAAVAFSPDGKRFATASSDGTARIWDTNTRAAVATLRHGGAVRAIAFHPDGRRLATAGEDKRALVWDIASRRAILTLSQYAQEVSAVAFNRSGAVLATATADGTVELWRADSGQPAATLPGNRGRITAVSFSPDERSLATSCEDGSVRVYALDPEGVEIVARTRVTRPFSDEDCRKYLRQAHCPNLK